MNRSGSFTCILRREGLYSAVGMLPVPPQGLSLVRIPEQVFADPANNVLNPERIEGLGRLLFFDPVLSDGKVACGSCHHPDQTIR